MNPKVSVIIPFYNAEETLHRAIESIYSQTFQDFECILVNNNSTDKSMKIAQSWEEKDTKFRVYEESRQGVAFASNKGAKTAQGIYIARMDADDQAYPNRLKLQAEFLDSNPDFGAVGGLVKYCADEKQLEGLKKYVDWVNSLVNYEDISNGRFVDAPIINPSSMWRKETGEQHGLYKSGNFPEDYEMWLRWLAQGVKIGKVNKYIIKWIDSEHRLTRTHPIYSDEAFYNIKSYYLAKWLSNHNKHHPFVMIWGASKISRRRAELLKAYGIKIQGYIDIKMTRQINEDIIYYKNLPDFNSCFILVYVRQWEAKKKIISFLDSIGYENGKNYLLVS
jgi:glycosyltransferase involved in cell wall biosynthesis